MVFAMKAVAAVVSITFFSVSIVVAGCGPRAGAPPVNPGPTMSSHADEIRAWHEKRIANLKKEHGWLSLVMLEWLEEGDNDIPPFGKIRITNGKATMNGVPFRTDADEGGPDKTTTGSKAFVVIKRGERYAVRMWDADAPTRTSFHGIETYPVASKWKVEARWIPYSTPRMEEVPSVIPGFSESMPVPGAAVFTIDGKDYRLEPVLEEGAEQLFFIFGDATNGKETYGAGRFLYAGPPKGGTIVIDFNKAYNPPCAFTPFATCPLPFDENRLPIRVDAGEKNFGGH